MSDQLTDTSTRGLELNRSIIDGAGLLTEFANDRSSERTHCPERIAENAMSAGAAPSSLPAVELTSFMPVVKSPKPTAEAQTTQKTTIGDNEYVIKTDNKGTPIYVKDDESEWTSPDGKSWTNAHDKHHVRHSASSIDSQGDFINFSTDYGWKSTTLQNGSTKWEIDSPDKVHYDVLKNKDGVPVEFTDAHGQWESSDGKSWTNTKSHDMLDGTVSITKFGEFGFKSDDSEHDESARSKQLQDIKDEESALHAKYGIKFAKPEAKTVREKHEMTNGLPSMDELKILERVLERTQYENFKGLNFWFVSEGDQKFPNLYGFYRGNNSHGPSVYLMPFARGLRGGFTSLEGTLQHELVHHEQYQRWGSSDLGKPGSPEETKTLIERMGWQYNSDDGYLLKDKTGGLWHRGDGKWEFAGGDEPADHKTKLSSKALRLRALVEPATSYFKLPSEEQADGEAMLRLDRAGLAKASPELYSIMREYDQQEIDRKLGKDDSGESTYIRAIDGFVEENTTAARAEIAKQETAWGVGKK